MADENKGLTKEELLKELIDYFESSPSAPSKIFLPLERQFYTDINRERQANSLPSIEESELLFSEEDKDAPIIFRSMAEELSEIDLSAEKISVPGDILDISLGEEKKDLPPDTVKETKDDIRTEDLEKLRTLLRFYPSVLRDKINSLVALDQISKEDLSDILERLSNKEDVLKFARFLEEKFSLTLDLELLGITPRVSKKEQKKIIAKKKKNKFAINLFRFVGFITILGLPFILYFLFFKKNEYINDLKYKEGLKEIREIDPYQSLGKINIQRKKAEALFSLAIEQSRGEYNSHYLNLYGLAYLNKGLYEDAFIKLYGLLSPRYGARKRESAWSYPTRSVPRPVLAKGEQFPSAITKNTSFTILDKDKIPRKVLIPGAYLTEVLRDQKLEGETILNLATFHSHPSESFIRLKKYKNDDLALKYYKIILNKTGISNDSDVFAKALLGVADIYYNQSNFEDAIMYYNRARILSRGEVGAHIGLLKIALKTWEQEKKPRSVISRHEAIKDLKAEDQISFKTINKLLAFHIDLPKKEKILGLPQNFLPHELKDRIDSLFALSQKKIDVAKEWSKIMEKEELAKLNYNKAHYFKSKRRNPERLAKLKDAYADDPKNHLVLYELGLASKDAKNYKDAKMYLLKSLEEARKKGASPTLRKNIAETSHALANLLFFEVIRNRYRKKSPFMPIKLISSDTNQGTSFPSTSFSQKEIESFSESQRYYQLAKEQQSLDFLADEMNNYHIALIEYMFGNFQETIHLLEDILKREENYKNTALSLTLGNAYYQTEDFSKAIGNYKHGIMNLLKGRNGTHNKTKEIHFSLIPSLREKKMLLYNNLASAYANLYSNLQKSSVENVDIEGRKEYLSSIEKQVLSYYQKSLNFSSKNPEEEKTIQKNLNFFLKRETNKTVIYDNFIFSLETKKEE